MIIQRPIFQLACLFNDQSFNWHDYSETNLSTDMFIQRPIFQRMWIFNDKSYNWHIKLKTNLLTGMVTEGLYEGL